MTISSPISNISILREKRRRKLSLPEESSRRCSSGAAGEIGSAAFRRRPDNSVLQLMAFLSIGLKDVAMSLARRGINLMQINRSILLRGSYANIWDYVALTKPRVMSLVFFTALLVLMVAPADFIPLPYVLALLST